jgi:hypothetical protein
VDRRATTRLAAGLLLGAVASACAHAPRREVLHETEALRCEEAAQVLADRPVDVVDAARRVVTIPLSYAATGLGYAGEIAVVFGGGVAAGVAICSPVIALESASGGTGEASAQCFLGITSGIWASARPGVGRGIFRATRVWRCPDLTQASRELRSVARCHVQRGWPDDAAKARALLGSMAGSRRFQECLPAEEREGIAAELAALGPDSAPVPPSNEPPPSGAPAETLVPAAFE